ncbi:uncharacterized protein BO97DRAFT_426579 [Aspergillus homomorphus CBS 101889]|uniref:Rhodopsin domain-containing protein n=1 Tax=Aspergillus homomorphus (strain CBS 101889) TaxID=1450537 RepID=A0A395HQU7_ASPHC|nr:hypothetical protein BO97DRAFT_426579 [Aspergillus homomorphus CBS 101889]RAL10322.1 hypothetical protein BO97DRAFT_426579 [Aspergillus homomorphus CBS 101889]
MDKPTLSLKVFCVSEWFFAVAVTSFRLAILCFYLELFRGTWFRWSTIVIMVIVVRYFIASLLTIALLCRPDSRQLGPNSHRDVRQPLADRMSKEKKVGVAVAFLFGLRYDA